MSITRCPVISGILGESFSLYGLPTRTGHFCNIVISLLVPSSVSNVTIVSNKVYSPSLIERIVPFMPLGTITLCFTIGDSSTSPRMSPPSTISPLFFNGVNFHFVSLFNEGNSIPRVRLLPVLFIISTNGRCIPSKILPINPGPSSTLSGALVDSTGSPGFNPEVSSYTCMDA